MSVAGSSAFSGAAWRRGGGITFRRIDPIGWQSFAPDQAMPHARQRIVFFAYLAADVFSHALHKSSVQLVSRDDAIRLSYFFHLLFI